MKKELIIHGKDQILLLRESLSPNSSRKKIIQFVYQFVCLRNYIFVCYQCVHETYFKTY